MIASADHVDRAVRDVEAFLAFQRARPSPTHDEHRRDVIGIWVDSTMVDAVPSVLDVASASCHGQFHVRESIGMNGLWSLWWLDVELADAATAVDTVRESLIATLAAIRPPRDDGRVPRFAPVFGIDQHPLAIHVEMNRLRELFPRLIGDLSRGPARLALRFVSPDRTAATSPETVSCMRGCAAPEEQSLWTRFSM